MAKGQMRSTREKKKPKQDKNRKPIAMFQEAKKSSIAALKADREREKTEAMREYQAEKIASLTNMARLRARRLAKENTDSQLQAAQRPAKRKTATRQS